jgi:hypothetical protein
MPRLLAFVAAALAVTMALASCKKERPAVTVEVRAMLPAAPAAGDATLVIGKQRIAAAKVERGTDPVDVIVVVEGTETFMGNDGYAETEPRPGAHSAVAAALDRLAKAGGPASAATLIVYGAKAEVRFDGPLAQLTADKLGAQRDFKGATAGNLAAAIETGLQHLERRATPGRRYLVVLSGGANAGGPEPLAALRKQLVQAKVEPHAIVFPTDGQDGASAGKLLAASHARIVANRDAITPAAQAVADRIGEATKLTFIIPGTALARGKLVEAVVEAGGRELEPFEIDRDRRAQSIDL